MSILNGSQVCARKSPVGGIGLFAEEDVEGECLRVTRKQIYNLETCLELKSQLDKDKEEPVVQQVLKYYSKVHNETRFLIAYMIGFEVLRRKGELKDHPELSEYLQLLLSTTVDNLAFEEDALLESYYEIEPGNALVNMSIKEVQSDEFEELSAYISDTWQVSIPGCDIRRLTAAVRSRTLEIPKIDEDGDYYVQISLVPGLDFANHDNARQNATFDVDPDTNEIVLKTTTTVAAGSEIFISYTPYEDMTRMFVTYGFIPCSNGLKAVDIPFWGYFHFEDSEELTEYLFEQQQPNNLQLILEYKDGKLEDLWLNMASNYSFAGFIQKDSIQTVMENASEEQIDRALIKLIGLVDKSFAERIPKLDQFNDFCEKYEAENGTCNIQQLVQLQLEVYRKYREKYASIAKHLDSDSLYDLVMIEGDEWVDYRLPPVYNFLTRDLERH
ncbi:hypothetical protein OGAPHI_006216 [Ogataea philodendri]|uniref:SET domain-containing protein n=1 Tax=Ogataea philodendri TaxID=1378263 RepID=A0A9P8NYV5_9ASCO|nr:uncharacterized protein OGAPHI_006216 [Ogataea philodendri]KAH3662035.1 hypothetical protein OGAPHI_006216 [Ogataea philodendri]